MLRSKCPIPQDMHECTAPYLLGIELYFVEYLNATEL